MAAIAAAATILPVGAEIQPGTPSLLQTIDANGILITINHEDCATNGANAQYRWAGFKREFRLCPGSTVDAVDHNAVRHEAIHAIQHCVNAARGTQMHTPVVTDKDIFVEFVTDNLSQETAEFIFANYPEEQWLVELEAFAGAEAYTAAEIEELFLKACVAS